MMTKQTEALKMAIEWMDKWHDKEVIVMGLGKQWIDFSRAIQACKEALEQPADKKPQYCGTGHCSCIECIYKPKASEQKPVAYMYKDQPNSVLILYPPQVIPKSAIPLYTHPAQSWQGLTIVERSNVIKEVTDKFRVSSLTIIEVELARAIEQALKEKNT